MKTVFIDFTERKGEKNREIYIERNTDVLFHLMIYPPVDSCMCPDWRLNLQPWCIGTTL